MKNILIYTILLFAVICNPANAMTVPSKADYDKFYQNLQNDMSAQSYGMTIFISLLQIDSGVPKENSINPFDPKFAACMQTALNQSFYDPTLKQSFDQYLTQVTPNEFKNDLDYLNSPSTQWQDNLYKNIFAVYAKSDNWRTNGEISLAKKKLELPKTDKEENLSESYYNFFSAKSLLGTVIGNQIKQCQKLQMPTK